MRKMVISSLAFMMASLFVLGCSGCGKAGTQDSLVKENSYDVLHMGAKLISGKM